MKTRIIMCIQTHTHAPPVLSHSNEKCCLVDQEAVVYAINHKLQIDLLIGYLIALFSVQSSLMGTPLKFKANIQD